LIISSSYSQNSHNKHPSFPSTQERLRERGEKGKRTREKQVVKDSGGAQKTEKKNPLKTSRL
jgi:hypothetical protein